MRNKESCKDQDAFRWSSATQSICVLRESDVNPAEGNLPRKMVLLILLSYLHFYSQYEGTTRRAVKYLRMLLTSEIRFCSCYSGTRPKHRNWEGSHLQEQRTGLCGRRWFDCRWLATPHHAWKTQKACCRTSFPDEVPSKIFQHHLKWHGCNQYSLDVEISYCSSWRFRRWMYDNIPCEVVKAPK